MKQLLKRHWPLAAVAAGYLALVLLLFSWCSQAGGGRFIYPLDDAYIHLAQARSLGLHGVWGVTSHEFSSSTSSPLWTLVLAASMRLAGVSELAPLALNFACGLGLLAALHAWLLGRVRSGWVEFLLLAFFALGLPMPLMTVIGMEHMLQVLLTVLFVSRFQSALAARRGDFRPALLLALLAMPLVMSRYEELFLVACAGLLLIVTGRWKAGAFLWGAAWVPVLIYGFFSIRHGGWLLPNTLLLKGNALPLTLDGIIEMLRRSMITLQVNLPVFVLLLLAAGAWCVNNSRPWERQGENAALLLLFIGTTALHTLFAQYGFLFRYEAYLIALGFMALVNFLFTFPFSLGAAPLRRRMWAWGAAACLGWLLLLPFWPRMGHSIRLTPTASRNIFTQQFQMARFIERFFPGQCVAVNDIGWVSFLNDPRLFDMWGLATQEVANAKRRGQYDAAAIDALTRARGVQFAIIYDGWFMGKIPSAWVPAGTWRILNNTICSHDTVTFYAVNPALAPRLADCLRRFTPELPRDVIPGGAFLTAPR